MRQSICPEPKCVEGVVPLPGEAHEVWPVDGVKHEEDNRESHPAHLVDSFGSDGAMGVNLMDRVGVNDGDPLLDGSHC